MAKLKGLFFGLIFQNSLYVKAVCHHTFKATILGLMSFAFQYAFKKVPTLFDFIANDKIIIYKLSTEDTWLFHYLKTRKRTTTKHYSLGYAFILSSFLWQEPLTRWDIKTWWLTFTNRQWFKMSSITRLQPDISDLLCQQMHFLETVCDGLLFRLFAQFWA